MPDVIPNLNLEREQAAFRELGHTRVRPAVARGLIIGFALTLLAVPGLEALLPAGSGAGRGADIAAAWGQLLSAPPTHCELEAFETQLAERSRVGAALRPRLQALLSGGLGLGNEQAYVGRPRWLFQRAAVDHLSGPPFLEPTFQRSRVRDADPCKRTPDPDPVAAIVRFHTDLSARGIGLVVVPTPVKGVLDGDRLGRAPAGTEIRNASFPEFRNRLQEQGVAVFDPVPVMGRWREQHGADRIFLATDTHWRPEAMEAVAEALAGFLEQRVDLGPQDAASTLRSVEARNRGDLVTLLDLPPYQTLFPLERVTIRQVRDADNQLWKPTPGAPVLLLGDSFSNIYSDRAAFAQSAGGEPLDWGESAGFAEHLSHHLGRPVDRIVRNAGGAHSTRRDLVRAVLAGSHRLRHVRVVVYQFAVRELSQGDWQILALPSRNRE
jgi:alginate O-acetyltransferase complex protein AlgJ